MTFRQNDALKILSYFSVLCAGPIIIIIIIIIKPPDIVCRRTYILTGFFLLSFFRQLISELAERNSTINHVTIATWSEVSVI